MQLCYGVSINTSISQIRKMEHREDQVLSKWYYQNVNPGSFPGGPAGKESARNAGDLGSIPGSGRSPGEGNGYAFQYSGLENPMDCIVYGVTRSQTQLSGFHFQRNSELVPEH